MRELLSTSSADAQSSEVSEYLDRVLNSERFRKAPSLRHLLQYLTAETLEGREDHIKETVIALEVFGRPEDFDSRIDNIVRVQAHRLRKLLDAYYENEGRTDGLRVAIPKGCYVPQFERASLEEKPAEPDSVVVGDGSASTLAAATSSLFAASSLASAPPIPRYRLGFVAMIGFLAGTLVAALFFWGLWRQEAPPSVSRTGDLLAPPVSALWKGFLEPGVPTVVAFTNPVFLHSQRSDLFLRYHGPLSAPWGVWLNMAASQAYQDSNFVSKAGPFFFTDDLTGTGEVLAVHKLTALFAEAGSSLTVRRSRALTMEEMRGANVIWIGSPWGNTLLEKVKLPSTPFSCCEGEAVTVLDPKSGEPSSFKYVRDETTGELSASYGLISVLPGVDPSRTILVAAGIATLASWASIDFVTSPEGVTQLMRHFGIPSSGSLPQYFQAVVRTEIVNGEASKTSLVTARVVSSNRNAAGTN